MDSYPAAMCVCVCITHEYTHMDSYPMRPGASSEAIEETFYTEREHILYIHTQ